MAKAEAGAEIRDLCLSRQTSFHPDLENLELKIPKYALFNKEESFLNIQEARHLAFLLSSTVSVSLTQELSLFKLRIMMHIVKVYYNRI